MADDMLLAALKTNLAQNEALGFDEKAEKLKARIAELEKAETPKASQAAPESTSVVKKTAVKARKGK